MIRHGGNTIVQNHHEIIWTMLYFKTYSIKSYSRGVILTLVMNAKVYATFILVYLSFMRRKSDLVLSNK
jgi:hypothetical protein